MRYYGRFPKEKENSKKKLSPSPEKAYDTKLSSKVNIDKTKNKRRAEKDAKHERERGAKWINNQTIPEMGDFKEKVVRLLQKSKKPMPPSTIGKKLNKSKEFVFIWLSSVGKHIKEIKKISTGKYSYEEKKEK